MKIALDRVTVTEAGEGVQVCFETEEDDDCKYVLIQRHLEEPDDGSCYIETHDENYRGHFWFVSAMLRRNQLKLELEREEPATMEVSFRASVQTFKELERVLTIMIPQLKIADAEGSC